MQRRASTSSVVAPIVLGVLGLFTLIFLAAAGLPPFPRMGGTTPLVMATSARAKSETSVYEVMLAGENSRDGGPATVKFDGGCLVTGSDGSSESKTIEGRTPSTYSYSGRGISCSYQKQGGSDRLRATVKRDGQIVKTIETSTEYGIISFAI
jgi:hypothetical protein